MNLASNVEFLKELSKNNSKLWMDENKKRFESEKAKLMAFTLNILDSLAEKNPDYSTILPKDCLFRQNRDVRFSKNKSPYKTNFGIVISLAGKKSLLFVNHWRPDATEIC